MAKLASHTHQQLRGVLNDVFSDSNRVCQQGTTGVDQQIHQPGCLIPAIPLGDLFPGRVETVFQVLGQLITPSLMNDAGQIHGLVDLTYRVTVTFHAMKSINRAHPRLIRCCQPLGIFWRDLALAQSVECAHVLVLHALRQQSGIEGIGGGCQMTQQARGTGN